MDEFIKALANVKWPVPVAIEYRVYYDPVTGNVTNYTNADLPGVYLLVDRETFANHRFDVKVVNGKLVRPNIFSVGKLVIGTSGAACHPDDITILSDEPTSIYWSFRQYE